MDKDIAENTYAWVYSNFVFLSEDYLIATKMWV